MNKAKIHVQLDIAHPVCNFQTASDGVHNKPTVDVHSASNKWIAGMINIGPCNLHLYFLAQVWPFIFQHEASTSLQSHSAVAG